MYTPKSKQWFRQRIGSRIFRDDIDCCRNCMKITEEGLIVGDEQHASYLADTDADFAAEGKFCNYRDTK